MDRKILIVDDEADILKYIGTLLEDHDYSTITTMDPFDAVDLAVKESPGLICLDIMMPKKSGLSLYRKIMQDDQLKKIPILIVSGVLNNGEIDFRSYVPEDSIPPPKRILEKPVIIEDLISAIEDLMDLTEPKYKKGSKND